MRKMDKTVKKNRIAPTLRLPISVIFYVAVFVVIYCLVGWIRPVSDDWYYTTSPNPDFSYTDLLPGKNFWRPFDALFGGFMALVPGLFPWLNRFFVVLAHILNAVLVKKIMVKTGVSRQWGHFASCFFLLSSSAWAVTVSPDALNQAYSLLLGLLAIWVHLHKGGYYYLLFSVLSLFWKESGISWFFVVPLFDIFSKQVRLKEFFKNRTLFQTAIKQIFFSFLVILGYFALRFILQGDMSLGGETGTYKVTIFSLSFIKNIVMLLASAAGGVDSIALFGTDKSPLLVCVTGGLSLLFIGTWCVAAVTLIRKKGLMFPLLCAGACVLVLAGPLSILDHAGEMHTYPVLFGMAAVYGYCFDAAHFPARKVLIGLLAIAIAFGISSAHKLAAIYDYSNQTLRVEKEIYTQYEQKPGAALFVVVDEPKGYSVFSQAGIRGTSYGLSMRQYCDWKDLQHTHKNVKTADEAAQYIQKNGKKYTQIFVVENDSVKKVK